MRIVFKKPKVSQGVAKVTVHLDGRLGFSKAAASKIGLEVGKYIKIGVNSDDENDTSLYMKVVSVNDDETFKVRRAGKYYYIQTRDMFYELNIDFRKKKVIYDISDFEFEGIKMYKLNRRMKDR